MTLAAIIDALTSKKGAALLVPAILLLGTTLAIGQNQPPPTEQAQKAEPATAPPSEGIVPASQKSLPAETGLSPAQRKEIEAIIKDYLINNPEVLMEAQNALEAKDGQDPG